MMLTGQEKRTTWIAFGAGALILVLYFKGLPLWNRWTSLGEDLAPKLQNMERLEARAGVQNALLDRRNDLATKLGAVEGREEGPSRDAPAPAPEASKPGPAIGSAAASPTPPPARPPSVRLTTYVSRQADAAGMPLTNLTPVTPIRSFKGGPSFTPTGIQISAETMIPSLIKFLHSLEKGNRLIRVEQMDLRRDIKKGQTVQVNMTLVGYEASGK